MRLRSWWKWNEVDSLCQHDRDLAQETVNLIKSNKEIEKGYLDYRGSRPSARTAFASQQDFGESTPLSFRGVHTWVGQLMNRRGGRCSSSTAV